MNGTWQFEIDFGNSGLERGLRERDLAGTITVPFCPESELSGIGHVDFMNAVWYRRRVEVPAAWAGRRVLLHFGAVDYDATVWVNGREVGRHRGGFTPFTCDLDEVVDPGGTAEIVVRARDPHRPPQPMGKQSSRYENYECFYTRTTGIWQTVWMEPVAKVAMERPRITPLLEQRRLRVEVPVRPGKSGYRVRVELHDAQGAITAEEATTEGMLTPEVTLNIPEDRVRAWSISDPHLYRLILTLINDEGKAIDQASSYAGLRSVAIDGKAVLINGEVVFQRLVLDQGFYPDGILTAPSDEALVRDIELSMRAGFNGARLHQKVFEERFLYHADRLGYMVWGEFPDWGGRVLGQIDRAQNPGADFITQWIEALQRDVSHPSIVGWCPLNETVQALTDHIERLDDVTRGMFLATRMVDPSRPVIDASGYSHRVLDTDVYDSHDYDQNPESFARRHEALLAGQPFVNEFEGRAVSAPYRGQPYFVSEFGGIWWNPNVSEGEHSWGYGDRPSTIEEFYDRFEGLCGALLDNPMMFGYCYTQLTDVYQEQNGIYGFDRSLKFDLERLAAIQQRPAAIEQQHTPKALMTTR